MLQTTINNPVSCYGIAVHSAEKVELVLKPAKADTGIVFIRKDISYGDNFVEASYFNVSETALCTKITNGRTSISTIEHLMAAIWGSNIDNLIIEVDGPEIPIMDGSSKPFMFMIGHAGVRKLNKPRKFLKIKKEVFVDSGKGNINVVSPSNSFEIDLSIDFPSKAIGKQSISYSEKNRFSEEVAEARTFGFIHELEYLRSIGLAKGASLENAIGLDQDKILNKEGLRFHDEFVRHKLLDAIGDFSTASHDILGSFKCHKPGHEINNLILRRIFDDPNNFEWVTK